MQSRNFTDDETTEATYESDDKSGQTPYLSSPQHGAVKQAKLSEGHSKGVTLQSAAPAQVILSLLATVTKGRLEESLAASRSLVRIMDTVSKEQVGTSLKEIVTELKRVRTALKSQS